MKLTNLCLAYAQTQIFLISEKNNLAPGLQASLAFGVCQLYNNVIEQLEKMPKFINLEGITYIKNRRLFYNGIGLIKY